MSTLKKETVNNFETLAKQYDINFVLKAIHHYEKTKEYHAARNERIKNVLKIAKEQGLY
jgi:hypothetical protein